MTTAEVSRIELPPLSEIDDLGSLKKLPYRDMRGQPTPFIAVDDYGVHERDDAIRALRTKDGGFVVQAAIADCGAITKVHHVVPLAIAARTNEYRGPKLTKSILPERIVKQFELGRGPSQAIIISQRFDPYANPLSDPDIFPANITTTKMHYDSFGDHCMREITPGYDQKSAFVEFTRLYRANRGLRMKTISLESNPQALKEHSSRVVATFMVIANIAVAKWAEANNLPVIYRHFPQNYSPKMEDENHKEGDPIYARYTHDPKNLHFGLSGHPEGSTYTHSSSPLRRGADAFNHAQFHLFWQSEQHDIEPIDIARVAEVAKYINSGI